MQSQDDHHALSYFNVCYKNLWQDSVNTNWNVCALYGTLWEPKILIQMLWARPAISGSCCCIKIVIYYQESICWWFSWFSSAVCSTVILPLQGENMAANHSRNFKEPLCTVQIHVRLYLGIVVRFWYQMLWSYRIMLSSCWNTDVLYYVDSKA